MIPRLGQIIGKGNSKICYLNPNNPLTCFKISKKEKCKFINLTSNDTRIEAQALYKKEGYKIINTTLFKKDL